MRSYVFVALLCATFAASAQLYRWTDERGRVHVTDTPPPPSARNVQQRSSSAGPATGGSDLPYSVQRAAQTFPVTLFTAPDCGPCGLARTLLNARGVPFREVLVVDEKQAAELKKAVGSLSVPALRVGTAVQQGFEQGAYHSLLDTAGYPRTGILPPRNQAAPKPPSAAKPPAEAAAPAGPEESSEPTSGPYAPR